MLVLIAVVLLSPLFFKKARVVAFSARKAIEAAVDDPIQENRYDIEKSESQLNQYRQNLSKLIAANILLKREKADAESDVFKYTNLATKAAKAGNREDVATALGKKSLHESRAKQIAEEVVKNETLIDAINSNIANHQNNIDTAKVKSVQLETRMANVSLRDSMLNTSVDTEGLNALNSLEEKVLAKEALSDAKSQVFSTSTLEQKYNVVDNDEVEALMKQHSV